MNESALEELRSQLKAVLAGEASLLIEAHNFSVNVDRVEAQVRLRIAEQKIFGSDDIMDIVMAGYMIGRKDQFFASMVRLFGKETLETEYTKVCMELGIKPKSLN